MKRQRQYFARVCRSTIIFILLVFVCTTAHGAETKYTCPMHPHYISDTFGTCPICGMDLVEMEGDAEPTGEQEVDGLTLPAYMIQHTGIKSRPAEMAYFGRSIRSFGEVVVNQRLQTDISLRVEGWIEELAVNAEGDTVRPDSLLFHFYSPQLVSAQQDFISALGTGNTGRINLTENRLRALGVQNRVIQEIRHSRKIIRNIPFYATQEGTVEDLQVRKGSYLRSGGLVMRIQGYETVWVQVNLAEQDISFVDRNSQVRVDFPNLGLHLENVEIDYISPTVDAATRTAELRLVIDNPDGTIRPGAYADVEINAGASARLTVGYASILQNKDGAYVIVDRGNGTFQAREVRPGLQYKGLVEVQAGLQEGEQVVVSGQFLIDSESALRESFQRMEKLGLSLADLEVSEEQMVLVNHLVEGALYLHEELSARRLPQPHMLEPAAQMAKKLSHLAQGTRLAYVADDVAAHLATRNEIITISGWQRLLSQLVETLKPWIVEGRPKYYQELGLAFYVDEQSRGWVQFSGELLNPYGSGKAGAAAITHQVLLDGSGQMVELRGAADEQ